LFDEKERIFFVPGEDFRITDVVRIGIGGDRLDELLIWIPPFLMGPTGASTF